MKSPDNLTEKQFMSKKAGRFSGVPISTVQHWTEKGLVVSETTGTGDRRKYSILNCVEIGLIKRMADDRLSFKYIAQVMDFFRTFKMMIPALEKEFSFLVIRELPGEDRLDFDLFFDSKESKENISHLKNWYKKTAPKRTEKILVYNISLVAQRIFKAIEKEA